MDTVILTIKPRHLRNIRIGVKKLELRKSFPKCEVPFEVQCCESGSGGKIIAGFICYGKTYFHPKYMRTSQIIPYAKDACVSIKEIREYAGDGKVYGWGVAGVVDYTRVKGHPVRHISDYGLDRVPQSWCYAKKGMG